MSQPVEPDFDNEIDEEINKINESDDKQPTLPKPQVLATGTNKPTPTKQPPPTPVKPSPVPKQQPKAAPKTVVAPKQAPKAEPKQAVNEPKGEFEETPAPTKQVK